MNRNVNSHLQEDLLYTDTEDRYGIYQITKGGIMDDFKFMRMEYVEAAGAVVDKNGYQLVYTDRLEAGETLDSLYEKFNLYHPEDYRGHSLSVSDVVVLRREGQLKAYYVDSFGFTDVPDFMREKLWELEKTLSGMSEAALKVGDYFIGIQEAEEGYDYSIYRHDHSLLDGGIYDNPEETMVNVLRFIVEDDLKLNLEHAEVIDYETLMEKVEEVEHAAILASQASAQEKKDIWLEYYVAECEEFHHLKGYEVYDSLEEAALNYRILREDGRKAYLGNSLGIIYHDNSEPIFDESEYPFIMGNVIRADGLDDVKHFAASKEVCEAVAKICDLFPDYQLIEPKNLQNARYPENMTAEELADALMQIMEEYDFYDYQDNLQTEAEQKQRILYDLGYDNKTVYIRTLKEIIEDDGTEAPQAELLLKRLEGYQSEHYPEEEPVVRVRYSEHGEFKAGSYYKFSDAEKKIQEIGATIHSRDRSDTNHDQRENYLLDYTLFYEKNGEKQKIDGYLGITSDSLSIIQNIKEQTEDKLSDETWLDNMRSKGEEIYQKYMTELADIQEYVLPYLQQFVSLPEREPISQQAQEVKEDNSLSVSIKKTGEKKMSIHEKIARNKSILANQNGRNTEIKEMDRM